MTDLVLFELLLVLVLVVLLVIEAMCRLDQAWARPALAVYLTVTAWYLLDLIYNDWSPASARFSEFVIAQALLQVGWFLISYRAILRGMAKWAMNKGQVSVPTSTMGQWRLLQGLVGAQAFLAVVGLIRTGGDLWNLLFPPAADPPSFLWARGGVGEGFDFLVAALGYTHIAVIAMLGVLTATARDPRLRSWAALVFMLALPPYLFQRARNLMLATLIPGILAYILVGHATWLKKGCFAVGTLLLINVWFLIVITSRDQGGGVGQGGLSDSLEGAMAKDTRHYGLDMMSELCYINYFLDNGYYNPNYGERYVAEIAAVVPRALWPTKPFIGIDYAIARGFSDRNSSHGVNTTVATGLIGQGLVNFGPIFGPVASAFLMSLWTVILAREWNRRGEFSHLSLFMLGLGLTFNMGRDITLLVLFPYLFAAIGVHAFDMSGRRQHNHGP